MLKLTMKLLYIYHTEALCKSRGRGCQLCEADELNTFILRSAHKEGVHEHLEIPLPPLIAPHAGMHHQFRDACWHLLKGKRKEGIDKMIGMQYFLFTQ